MAGSASEILEKMMSNKIVLETKMLKAAGTAALLLLMAACNDDGMVLENNTKFDPAKMEAEIRNIYEGKAVGFSYAINHKGKLARSGAWGQARRPVDGALPMTPDTRVHLASVSKTVNTILFLRTLRIAREWFPSSTLDLDQAVSPWLPDEWVQGGGFAGNSGVTFRQLLAHKSGLKQMWNAMSEADRDYWGNDWDGLQFVVANGTVIPDPEESGQYKNANHALFRILIPKIHKHLGLAPFVSIDETSAGNIYVDSLNKFVMQPIGINERVDCRFQDGGNYAMFYDLDGPRVEGFKSDRSDADCGGHAGLYMSALELARLLAYTRHSDELLTDVEREPMFEDALGWFWSEPGDEASARLRGRGDWYRNYNFSREGYWITTKPEKRQAALHTCVIKYPSQVEAVLLINSSLAEDTPTPCNGLSQAYQAALVTP